MNNKFEQWKKQNPLRKFRINHDNISRMRLAAYMGVSMNTVQFWENGSSTPKEENFKKIAEVMSTPEEKVKERWDNWLNKKPQLDIA